MSPDEMMAMTPALVAFGSVPYDCNILAQTMLQWLAYSPTYRVIDAEIRSLENDSIGGDKFVTYLRYDAPIESEWLKDDLGIEVAQTRAMEIFAMDRFDNANILSKIGEGAARLQLKPEHFPRRFDAS